MKTIYIEKNNTTFNIGLDTLELVFDTPIQLPSDGVSPTYYDFNFKLFDETGSHDDWHEVCYVNWSTVDYTGEVEITSLDINLILNTPTNLDETFTNTCFEYSYDSNIIYDIWISVRYTPNYTEINAPEPIDIVNVTLSEYTEQDGITITPQPTQYNETTQSLLYETFNQNNTGAIIGISIISALLIAGIAAFGILWYKKRKNKQASA